MELSRANVFVVLAAVGLAACGGGEGGAPVSEAEARPAQSELPAAASLVAGEPVPAAEPGAVAAAEQPEAAPVAAPESEVEPAPEPAVEAVDEQSGQANAAAIMQRAERANSAIRSLEADFSQLLTVPLLDSSQRSRGKLYLSRPGRFSMRFTDPAGDLLVADGRSVWMYYPSTDKKQVIKASIAAAGEEIDFHRQFLSNSAARYNATLNGTESVGGQQTYALTLTPKTRGPFTRAKIWVDTDDYLVRRFEMTESNESVRRIDLSNIRVNPTIAANIFTFTPPAWTQVFEQ